MTTDLGIRAIVRSIMAEVEAVANRLGKELPISIEQRIAGAEQLGEQLGIDMLHTRTVYASAKLLESTSTLRREHK